MKYKILLLVVILTGLTGYFLKEPSQQTVLPAIAVETKPVVEDKPPVILLDPLELLTLVNEERTKAGVGTLIMDGRLVESAKAKCLDMQANDYFAHNDLQGNTPFVLIERYFPTYEKAGENLSSGVTPNSRTVVVGWYNSPTHQKNMLDPDFVYTGTAVCSWDANWSRPTDGHYSVQHFAQ